MPPDSTVRMEATVYGLVQGVYFRHYTQQEARRLQLVGWVANQSDGSVRVVAEGEEPSLREFMDFLQHGPPAARVERVEVEWMAASGDYSAFRVTQL